MRSLTIILFLISTLASSASASITLSSNFMPFSGLGGDIEPCRALYNSRIDACTDTTDFLSNNYCTSGCQLALRNMEAKLNNFCRGVTAEQGTLLAAIFAKKLVESVCRDGGAMGPQSSGRVTTVTKAVATETARLTTTMSGDEGEEPTTTLRVTSSSSVTLTISTSTTSDTISATNFPISTSPPTPTPSPPAPKSTPGWREKARQDQACAILQGGGGSPFDNMINFKYPTDGKDMQQRIRECQGIAAQRVRDLKGVKSGAGRVCPSRVVGLVVGVGIGLMVFV